MTLTHFESFSMKGKEVIYFFFFCQMILQDIITFWHIPTLLQSFLSSNEFLIWLFFTCYLGLVEQKRKKFHLSHPNLVKYRREKGSLTHFYISHFDRNITSKKKFFSPRSLVFWQPIFFSLSLSQLVIYNKVIFENKTKIATPRYRRHIFVSFS